jgi:hypothetical protein
MKSFFDLQNRLNEAIDQYSAQALGRKRNTMLRALTLDDSEFERWVHDRVIRFAEQNGIPLQQLDVGAFKSGFNEWQQQLQQSDKSYGEVKDQVSQYISRFLAVAPGIIARYQSGENAPVKEPLSPTMVPYEGDGMGQGAEQAPAEGEQQVPEPQYATAPEPVSAQQIQDMQRDVMSMVDMTNPVSNMGDDESRINRAAWNDKVRNLADEIAQANQVDRNELNYDMIDNYIQSLRQSVETNVGQDIDIPKEDLDMWEAMIKKEFFDSYGIKQPQQEAEERARLIAQQKMKEAAMDPKVIQKIFAEDAETGLLSAIERLTGETHLSPSSKARTDRKMSDVHKTYFDIQAEAMFEKYPFLQGAKFQHLGRTRGKLTDMWKEHGSTASTAKTTKTDIVATLADGNFVRYDEGTGTFIRCSMREVEDGGCTNTINFSFKKGESQLMSGRDKETKATLETALSNLTQMGYNFEDENALADAFIQQQGLDEDTAGQKAQAVVSTVKQIRELTKSFVEGKTYKGQVGFYQTGGAYRDSEDPDLRKTQEVIDSAGPFLEQINQAISNLSENMPEIIGEMAYIAASGDGKFEQGSKEIATHFLSLSNTDPESGPKIVPITRRTMYNVASSSLTTKVLWKSQSVGHTKKKLKPLFTQQAAQTGLEGEDLQKAVRQRLDAELPYTFSTVLRMIMEELPDTQMMEEVFTTVSKLLREEKEENVFDRVQGVSDMTKKYAQEGFDWAFSNMDNMTKFFEMDSEVGDINLPDFGEDFGDTHFKKEIQDEVQDLDML